MKHKRFVPPCPSCLSEDTKVIATWTAANVYRIVRRRHCKKCGHRFYTGQNEEQSIDSSKIKFPSSTRSFKSPLYLVEILGHNEAT